MKYCKLFLKSTLLLILVTLTFFNEDLNAWANKPKLGECYSNDLGTNNIFIIHEGPHFSVSVGHLGGKISGFNTIIDLDFVDEDMYNVKKVACPMFTSIDETVKEVIKAFGLSKDFTKAVCKSRDINYRRNVEVCKAIK